MFIKKTHINADLTIQVETTYFKETTELVDVIGNGVSFLVDTFVVLSKI